jgi:hypothetical protein
VLQGAFLHPHFEILEVKKKPDCTSSYHRARQESREAIPQNQQKFDTFLVGGYSARQETRPAGVGV